VPVSLEKPIFVVGVGRSGSTAFHRLLAEHPDVVWLSSLCDRFPGRPSANGFLMKAVDLPLLGPFLKGAFDPRECWDFWERHCKGFSTPCRDLTASDVTNRARRSIRNALSHMMSDRRRRLLIKITGWPRLGYLREIFPDAKFVHILRDGRAVVNSLVNVDWWWGWRGPSNWRLGPLPESLESEWKSHNRSFIALAAIEWKLLMDSMESAKAQVPQGGLIELRYEDLCEAPAETTRSVLDFCELKWPDGFEDVVKKNRLRSVNYKWKEELTDEQKRAVGTILHDHLAKYGYA
jgi:hypothetical protein